MSSVAKVPPPPPFDLPPDPPAPVAELEPPPDLQPIATAPKDRGWIEVSADGVAWTPVRWYQTRVRSTAINWVKAECWSTSDPPKLMHKFEGAKYWREMRR
jgi:hypothetical protein